MARGAGNDRTITAYTHVARAGRELGLPGTDTIGVLLVDRWGRILGREHGGFDDVSATRLTAKSKRRHLNVELDNAPVSPELRGP
jgi:hypothetical protein